MKTNPILLSFLGVLTLAACSNEKTTIADPVAVQDDFQSYAASLFHETTNFGLSDSGGFGFSADGSKILMSTDVSGIFNAQTMSIDGVQTAITSSTDYPYSAQSFFPNDDRIILEGDQGGNELDHVYVRDLEGNLTDITPGDKTKASFWSWRDDGNVFYVLTNERDAASNDIYAYNPDDLSRELVFENESLEVGAISGDGNWLALVKNETSAN